jgi:hypothetical protein
LFFFSFLLNNKLTKGQQNVRARKETNHARRAAAYAQETKTRK